MSALAVQPDARVEQLTGQIVHNARSLICRDWNGKLKQHLRSMIRWYSQEAKKGADHWKALKLAKGKMKCPTARAKFTEIMTEARTQARTEQGQPKKPVLSVA